MLIPAHPIKVSFAAGVFSRAAALGQRVAVAWYLVACGLAMRYGLRNAELVFLVAALLGDLGPPLARRSLRHWMAPC
jgi:hypothetical protein